MTSMRPPFTVLFRREKNSIKTGPDEVELPLVVPVTDLVRIIVDNKISGDGL